MRRELVASRGLLVRVVPFVLLAGLGKLAVHGLGWDTVELNPLFSGLVTATVFLLGFLLAGTLVDYKESERLPGDIASQMETIADECVSLHEAKGEPAATRCVKALQQLAHDVNGWLRGEHRVERVLRSLEMLNPAFLELEPLIQPAFLSRLKLAQADIRKMVIRIEMIRQTSFVMAGYAIAHFVSVLLVGALLFAAIEPLSIAVFFTCIVSFFFSYMIFLITDLDDPFDYAGAGPADSRVSLKALDLVEERLAVCVGKLEREDTLAPAGAIPAN